MKLVELLLQMKTHRIHIAVVVNFSRAISKSFIEDQDASLNVGQLNLLGGIKCLKKVWSQNKKV